MSNECESCKNPIKHAYKGLLGTYCSQYCLASTEMPDTNSIQAKEKTMRETLDEIIWCDRCGESTPAIKSYLDFDSQNRYCSDTCLHNSQGDSPSAKQEGGNHYKDYAIEPIDFVHANGLSYIQGNVIKYIVRYKDKNGLEDLKKAKHYIDLLIEREYKDVII